MPRLPFPASTDSLLLVTAELSAAVVPGHTVALSASTSSEFPGQSPGLPLLWSCGAWGGLPVPGGATTCGNLAVGQGEGRTPWVLLQGGTWPPQDAREPHSL